MVRALRKDSPLGRIGLSNREKEVLIAWFRTESKDEVCTRLNIAPTRGRLRSAPTGNVLGLEYAAVISPTPTKSASLARLIESGVLSLRDL